MIAAPEIPAQIHRGLLGSIAEQVCILTGNGELNPLRGVIKISLVCDSALRRQLAV
jgi:hypothetical protein